MTEEKESSAALLQDEALLRRVLEQEPALVGRIVSHADFQEALFSLSEALRGLMRAPLVEDDLANVGRDGASLRRPPSREEARLRDLLMDAEALGNVFRKQPALVVEVVTNPAFVEQVKVRNSQFYTALLEQAQQRFGRDAEMTAEIQAERESLELFTSEGGRKEQEAVQRQRESRKPGEKLLDAARDGRTAVVRALLEKGADPNLQNEAGWTALMKAAFFRGHADTVRALLAGGADPNLRDNQEYTALMYAAYRGHADAVQALLEGGADPNLQNRWGSTARDVTISRSLKELLSAAERKQGRHGGPQQDRGR